MVMGWGLVRRRRRVVMAEVAEVTEMVRKGELWGESGVMGEWQRQRGVTQSGAEGQRERGSFAVAGEG